LYLTQTPQLFEYKALYKAYLHNKEILDNFTDDAQILAKSDLTIHTVAGDINNIKITTDKDWINKINIMHKNYKIKIGHGFDTHKLIKGKYITLFGIKIPHEYTLLGHSDADVGVHAIIDALLGSCSLGDIGKHFPDTDKNIKGINSLIMLSKTKMLLSDSKVSISHIDCTLVGESPKIAKYTNKMITNLAKTLRTEKENISIKATTTEGLGFTGRREGISCYCVATIKQESKI
jgi:2-C-methyl-D-erythritol 2,4-cyclodiphosphate synthase